MSDLVRIEDTSSESVELEPGYYECIAGSPSMPVGTIVYLTNPTGRYYGEDAHYIHNGNEVYTDTESFAERFIPRPDGADVKSQQLAEAMSDLAKLNETASREAAELSQVTPYVASGQMQETGVAISDGTLGIKTSVAKVRKTTLKIKDELERKAALVKAMIAEQTAIIQASISDMQSVVDKWEEALWTVNLYLGTNETIKTLRDGAPAPKETPITIRQLVLFMDEECAASAETGGIDIRNIDAFDDWILADPKHLSQILPEEKGVVTLRVRRKDKNYGDMDRYSQALLNDENKKRTYFLFRNGEKLFRMATEFTIGDVLVPRSDEFLDYFVEKHYNRTTGEMEVAELEPGSKAYMQAEKRASSLRRHFFRVGLILQGILDRTPIFHPLNGRIVVTNPESYKHDIQIITDAERGLPDGKERFADWLSRINHELTPGMRILGIWHGYSGENLGQYANSVQYGLSGSGNSRLHPETAEYPDEDDLHTIEGRRKNLLYFYYKRKETYYPRDWSGTREYSKRASCDVSMDDRFILNFDAATVEDMEFYLQCRTDRTEYMYMFPLLKLAIRKKREEEAYEMPFKELLAGNIITTYDVSYEDALQSVTDLITWWKFKNKTHRAIPKDDPVAYKDIMREYAVQFKADTKRKELYTSGWYDNLVKVLRKNVTDVLMIGHRPDDMFSVFVPANKDHIFIHEQLWFVNKNKRLEKKETREWRVRDTRYLRWNIVYTSDAWAIYPVGLNKYSYLTDPEIERMPTDVLDWAHKEWEHSFYKPKEKAPIAITIQGCTKLRLYWIISNGELPEPGKLLTGTLSRPSIEVWDMRWTRDASRNPVITGTSGRWCPALNNEDWDNIHEHPFIRSDNRILMLYDKALDNLAESAKAYDAVHEDRLKHRDIIRKVMRKLNENYVNTKNVQAYHKFMQEYGDPDLWEGHLKTLRIPQSMPNYNTIDTVLEHFEESSGIPYGCTVEELLAKANPAWIKSHYTTPEFDKDELALVLQKPEGTTS